MSDDRPGADGPTLLRKSILFHEATTKPPVSRETFPGAAMETINYMEAAICAGAPVCQCPHGPNPAEAIRCLLLAEGWLADARRYLVAEHFPARVVADTAGDAMDALGRTDEPVDLGPAPEPRPSRLSRLWGYPKGGA